MKLTTIISALAFFALSLTSLRAQTVNTWKGGFPGHESDWAFSKNWSLGHAPSEFDRVVIPDMSANARKFPVVRTGTIELAGLAIESNASLTLLSDVKILLTGDFQNMGSCNGCDARLWISGDTHGATADVEN